MTFLCFSYVTSDWGMPFPRYEGERIPVQDVARITPSVHAGHLEVELVTGQRFRARREIRVEQEKELFA